MAGEEKKDDLLAPSNLFDAGAAALLFKPEDVARLKLTLLTGVNAAEKIEAIRKLAFAPIDKPEKGALYLSVLTDPDASVRHEAALALRTLGVSADFAEALSTLSIGTVKQKALAASKIKAGAAGYTGAERSVAVAFVASSLSYETDPEIRSMLVETLVPLAPAAAENAASLGLVLRAVLRATAEDFTRLSPHARAVFEAAAKGGAAVGDVLWAEARTVESRELRQFLQGAVLAVPMSETTRREALAAAAKDIAAAEGDDLEFRTLRQSFTAAGDAALDAFLPLAREAGVDKLQSAIAVLDGLAGAPATTADGRRKVVEFLLDLWERGERAVRMAIMDASAWNGADLPFELRQTVARRFIDQLHTFDSGLGLDLAWTAVRRLGPASIAPLRHTLTESPYAAEREAAARLVADIVLREPLGDAALADLIRLLRGLERADSIPPGLAVRVIGTLASRLTGEAPLLAELYADLRSRIGRVSWSSDLFVALCRIAAAPGADPVLAGEMSLQILEVLTGELPSPTYEEKQGPDGREVHIGGAYQVYTEFVPDILEGLAAVWTAGRLAPNVRDRIFDALLKKWDDVVNYRDVWAPANLLHLGEALVKIGGSASCDAARRRRILAALCGAYRNTSVLRILARLAGRADDPSDEYATQMETLALNLFKMLGMNEYSEAGDRAALIFALGCVGASPRIGTSDARTKELRRRIVEQVIEDRTLEARDRRDVLSILVDSAATPDDLRDVLKRQRTKVSPGVRAS